jgi:hypothetical protein
VVIGTNSFWGYSSTQKKRSYSYWTALPACEFKNGLPKDKDFPYIHGERVVGFDGIADFWDMAKGMVSALDYNLQHHIRLILTNKVLM